MANEVCYATLQFDDEQWSYENYLKTGGYKAWSKILKDKMTPEDVIEEVKASGLRGRGGAGFPAGIKWDTVRRAEGDVKYVACNADEGDPGAFMDRSVLESDPFRVIEGMAIAAFAVHANEGYVYVRAEYPIAVMRLERAVEQARQYGLVGTDIMGRGFDFDLQIVEGAGAFVCGEETALLESIEGKKGQPRSKPPFPAVVGLYDCPTIINNVQTIASLPFIIQEGADAYKAHGTEKSCGTHLFGISGHVEKPGMYELPLGLPLMEVLEKVAGGVWKGRKLKGVIPGGSSTPVLTPEEAKTVNLDYESMAEHKTMFGSGGIVVLDETVDIVKLVENLIYFYHHESCGQCTPCREGLGWMLKIVKKLLAGEGSMADIDLLVELCDNIEMKTVCVLSAACTMPVRSYLNKFRHEFEAYVSDAAS